VANNNTPPGLDVGDRAGKRTRVPQLAALRGKLDDFGVFSATIKCSATEGEIMATINSYNNMATKTALYLRSVGVCEALLEKVQASVTRATQHKFDSLQEFQNAKVRLARAYAEITTIIQDKHHQSTQKVTEMHTKIMELTRNIQDDYTAQARTAYHNKAS
jgi:hypothetical protein